MTTKNGNPSLYCAWLFALALSGLIDEVTSRLGELSLETALAGSSTPQERSLASFPPKGTSVVKGVNFVYQVPGFEPEPTVSAGAAQKASLGAPVTSPPPQPAQARGVALLLHSCNGNAEQFWKLPEEGQMTAAVLQKGLAAVAADAKPGIAPNPGCWHPEIDGPVLNQALPVLLQQLGLEGKPIYGFGISSGGAMLTALAAGLGWRFSGLHFQVSFGPAYLPVDLKAARWPRTSFVYMPYDPLVTQRAVEDAAASVHAAGAAVQLLEVRPKTLGWLVDRAAFMGLDRDYVEGAIRAMAGMKDSHGPILEERFGGCASATLPAARAASADVCIPACQQPVAQLRAAGPGGCVRLGGSTAALNLLPLDQTLAPKMAEAEKAASVPTWLSFKEELLVAEGKHGATAEHFDTSLDFLLASGAS